MKKKWMVAVCAVASLTVALAGCGGHPAAANTGPTTGGSPASTQPPASTSTVTQTAPQATVSATTTPSAPTSPLPLYCLTSELRFTYDVGHGAGGSQYSGLHAFNTGSRTCTVSGYPGVSFVAPGNGQQVGKPAERQKASVVSLALAPGAEASALYVVGNITPTGCSLVTAAGIRVYPPNNTSALYIPFPQSRGICPRSAGSEIYPLRAGASFSLTVYGE